MTVPSRCSRKVDNKVEEDILEGEQRTVGLLGIRMLTGAVMLTVVVSLDIISDIAPDRRLPKLLTNSCDSDVPPKMTTDRSVMIFLQDVNNFCLVNALL